MAKRVSLKGKGADLFFGDYAPEAPPSDQGEPAMDERDEPVAGDSPAPADESPGTNGFDSTDELAAAVAQPMPARPIAEPSPTPARAKVRSHASKQAINNRNDAETVEAIRKTVKTLGREVSFVRLTPEEKGALAEVVYAYKRHGVKTTENEINRIAINALLADYHANGDASLLARVLAALRA